jgi:hypothetical protein
MRKEEEPARKVLRAAYISHEVAYQDRQNDPGLGGRDAVL